MWHHLVFVHNVDLLFMVVWFIVNSLDSRLSLVAIKFALVFGDMSHLVFLVFCHVMFCGGVVL